MRFLIVSLLLILQAGTVAAENVALVIGNATYRNVEPLANPENDAHAIANALEAQGFKVTRGINLERGQMYNLLRDFRDTADAAELAMVYYAGHGIEIGGQNYLIPVDARLADERDAPIEMVAMDVVLSQLSGAKKLKMVVLDACRDNPFVAKMERENRGRNVGRGLALISNAEADTLIAYAAAAGEVTPDGTGGGNSPFTSAFLNAMAGPPADVRLVLGALRDELRTTVPGASPFVYSSLGRDLVVINPKGHERVAKATELDQDVFLRDFATAEFAGTVDAWGEFLGKYEDFASHTLYLVALRNRRQLQGTDETESPSRRLNEVTENETTNPPATVEAQPEAEVIAALPVQVPERPLRSREELFREIQAFLKDRKCYRGSIDGIWGGGSRGALSEFAKASGSDIWVSKSSNSEQLADALKVIADSTSAYCVSRSDEASTRRDSTTGAGATASPRASTARQSNQSKPKSAEAQSEAQFRARAEQILGKDSPNLEYCLKLRNQGGARKYQGNCSALY